MALPVNFLTRSITMVSTTRMSAFVLLQKQCFCPTATQIQIRGKAKRTSKFPKDDAVTRMEELGKKLNPIPPSTKNEPPPNDHGFKIDSTGQIFSSYVPPEKKNFILTAEGISQRWEAIKAGIVTTYAIATIKRKVKPFKVVDFAKLAQKKFIDLNNSIQQENDKVSRVQMKKDATLMVVKALSHQFLDPAKKVHWRFIKEIERPRVIHARVSAVYEKDNLFAQVTVKMHTEQILAIRDRHNRVIKGDLKKSRNVIDYVVFERHLADPYGQWRVCGKLFA